MAKQVTFTAPHLVPNISDSPIVEESMEETPSNVLTRSMSQTKFDSKFDDQSRDDDKNRGDFDDKAL